MKILGIDYGDARVGVAVSDALLCMAQALPTITVKGSRQLVDTIKEIAVSHDITKIVLGMPKNMDGSIGERGKKSIEFSEILKEKLNVEVILWDERLTTVAAHRTLSETNVRGKKRKAVVDAVAACYILQGYLDSIK